MITEDIMKKLNILTASAKYDVACTSSGVTRQNGKSGMGNSIHAGICHSFSSDGRCISLLKVLYTNECIYDCKYCINRRSNDVERTSFTPEELARLTISFYKRNYIEGLFLSSGVTRSPDNTMEQIYQAIRLLRYRYEFHGYIHVKVIPGTDDALIEKLGWLADRMSVNMELPTADSLASLAPHKTRSSILTPMRSIQLKRNRDLDFHGDTFYNRLPAKNRPLISEHTQKSFHLSENTLKNNSYLSDYKKDNSYYVSDNIQGYTSSPGKNYYKPVTMKAGEKRFVPSGQSTQLIIGASKDTDYEIIKVSEALYDRFNLKRVFYSAFINVNRNSSLPDTSKGPDLLREHRLYQADWLLRFYNFAADEIISADHPSLNTLLDPKCNYALNHLELFPVEIMTASYHTLLRVPGIGVTSAKRIVSARSNLNGSKLSFNDLKKIGVVLKRAGYFITCNGKSMIPLKITQSFILANLLGLKDNIPGNLTMDQTYEQLSLFDVSDIVEEKLQAGIIR